MHKTRAQPLRLASSLTEEELEATAEGIQLAKAKALEVCEKVKELVEGGYHQATGAQGQGKP